MGKMLKNGVVLKRRKMKNPKTRFRVWSEIQKSFNTLLFLLLYIYLQKTERERDEEKKRT